MKNFKSKIIAITGAASGIGKELAIQLAEQGASLALSDWDKDGLSAVVKNLEASNTAVLGYHFDVRDRQEWQSFSKQIVERFGHLDMLINNAGIAQYPTLFDNITEEAFSIILDINMWGCIHGTQTMLPLLKNRPESSLVNMSSSLGLSGYPYMGAYSISKFAIKGITETLQVENLANKNFHIMSVHPGGVHTNLVKNLKNVDQESINKLNATFQKYSYSTPAVAAQKIIRAIKKKKKRAVIGKDGHFMDIISRLFPSFYYSLLPKRQKPKKK